MKIAYQGIPGAYSDAACQKWLAENQFLNVDVIGMNDFKRMVEALLLDEVDYGIFPIENSTTGLITRTLDLFRHKPLLAVAEVYQEVAHVLWGTEDSQLEELTTVYSHPEALSQCQKLFDTYPFLKAENAADTARSAKMVAEKQDPKLAALASPIAGKLYHLKPLLKEVQTEEVNVTRFFVMKKQVTTNQFKENISFENNHWYLYFETLHQPGALGKIIQVVDLFHLNMEGLHARPVADEPFKYGFLMEMDVSSLKKITDRRLFWEMLQHSCESLQLLGNFIGKTKEA